jgi:HK97 family phage portal protein
LVGLLQRIGVWLGGAGVRVKGIQSGDSGAALKTALPVSMDTALQLSAAWACVKLTAEAVGSLPLKIYEIKANGERVETKEHPLAVLFRGKVNRWQTRQEYFESITYQKAMVGNNYSAIQRSESGKKDIIGMVPLMAAQVIVNLEDNGDLTYRYQDSGSVRVFASQTVWHNKMFGNGTVGLSPLSYARGSLGIAQAAEAATTNIYQNGGKPSGVLMLDKVLTDSQRDRIKANFAELAEGNDDRLFVLEAGMKYQQVSLSPSDIELLSSRRFQVEDIARFYGVPSVLINDLANSSAWGSGIGQIIEGWYKLGLRPIIKNYEESIRCNLMGAEERDRFCAKFDLDELLSPSFAERVKVGKDGVQGGLIMPNEWRAQEGMTAVKGGDRLFMQQQMVGIDKLDEIKRGGNTNAPQDTSQQ